MELKNQKELVETETSIDHHPASPFRSARFKRTAIYLCSDLLKILSRPLASSHRELDSWVSLNRRFFLKRVIKKYSPRSASVPPGFPIKGSETRFVAVRRFVPVHSDGVKPQRKIWSLQSARWRDVVEAFFLRVCRHHVRVLHRALDLDGLGNHGNHGYDAALPRGERTRECKRAVRWLIGP